MHTWSSAITLLALASLSAGCNKNQTLEPLPLRPSEIAAMQDARAASLDGAGNAGESMPRFAAGFVGEGVAKDGQFVELSGGMLYRGDIKDASHPSAASPMEMRPRGLKGSLMVAKGTTQLQIKLLSQKFQSVTFGTMRTPFADGAAVVTITPLDLFARAPALTLISYGSSLGGRFLAEGPGGPYWGVLDVKLGFMATAAIERVVEGPLLFPGERERPARRANLVSLWSSQATGGGPTGLWTMAGASKSYSVMGEEIDLIALGYGSSRTVGTCAYVDGEGNRSRRSRIVITDRVVVYDRKTGAKVAERSFAPDGPHPGCAGEIQAGDGNFVHKPGDDLYENFYAPLLTDFASSEPQGD